MKRQRKHKRQKNTKMVSLGKSISLKDIKIKGLIVERDELISKINIEFNIKYSLLMKYPDELKYITDDCFVMWLLDNDHRFFYYASDEQYKKYYNKLIKANVTNRCHYLLELLNESDSD